MTSPFTRLTFCFHLLVSIHSIQGIISICPSALSTFSGWYPDRANRRNHAVPAWWGTRRIAISPSSCSKDSGYAGMYRFAPRRTYNGWRSPPSSTCRYRPHPDLQNLPPRETLQWLQISSSAHPLAGCCGNGWWYYGQSYIAVVLHEAYVITTELFYATAGIDITQMQGQESEASCGWYAEQPLGEYYGKSARFICSMMRWTTRTGCSGE